MLRCTKGTTAVEFALLAPVFFTMLLGIIEFGWQMFIRVSLDYALAQTARCYELKYVDATAGTDCSSLTGATTYWQAQATDVPFNQGAATLANPTSGCLQYSYAATWLMPGIMVISAPTYTNKSCFYY